MTPEFLREEVVHLLHDTSIECFGGSPGLKDRGLLSSALARAENKFYYDDPKPDIFDLAAAYAFGIARNHPFQDGNKRTAWASCVSFLLVNGITFHASFSEREEKVVGLATGTLAEAEFASWLRLYGCYQAFWIGANDV